MRVFIPGDAAAVSVGADEVAEAISKALPEAIVVRTGSRGLFNIEPLVEIEGQDGHRTGFGPIEPVDVPSLVAALRSGPPHAKALGRIDEIPFFKRQTRLTFARCGLIAPLSTEEYASYGGWRGLERARAIGSEQILEEMKRSGLRGRGGAAFPVGMKWETVARAPGDQKYVVCNADEGDSGTFADRMLMEGDPFQVIEGMGIAALAVGADQGFLYIRSEYPHAVRAMQAAIELVDRAQLLPEIRIEIRVGAGAYVCGEETAMLESLEGRRGQVRPKPPLPAHSGLFGKPTVINNVLSFAAATSILANGPEVYAAYGIERSKGTIPIQLAGNVRNGGLFEVPFGITLDDLIHDIGGGSASGRPVRAAQVGGPLGAYFPSTMFDTPFDYESLTAAGGLLGHGGVVVFDDTVDMARMARFALAFCAAESCGKCTPCRVGSTRGVELIDRMLSGHDEGRAFEVLDDLCEALELGSLCALGGFTPYPVRSALRHFAEDFPGLSAKGKELMR